MEFMLRLYWPTCLQCIISQLLDNQRANKRELCTFFKMLSRFGPLLCSLPCYLVLVSIIEYLIPYVSFEILTCILMKNQFIVWSSNSFHLMASCLFQRQNFFFLGCQRKTGTRWAVDCKKNKYSFDTNLPFLMRRCVMLILRLPIQLAGPGLTLITYK